MNVNHGTTLSYNSNPPLTITPIGVSSPTLFLNDYFIYNEKRDIQISLLNSTVFRPKLLKTFACRGSLPGLKREWLGGSTFSYLPSTILYANLGISSNFGKVARTKLFQKTVAGYSGAFGSGTCNK